MPQIPTGPGPGRLSLGPSGPGPGYSRIPTRRTVPSLTPQLANHALQTAEAEGRIAYDRAAQPSFPPRPGHVSPERAFLFAYRRALERFGLPTYAAQGAARTALERSHLGIVRPSPFLSVAAKVLNIPAEAASGFIAGYSHSATDSSNPWDIVKSIPHQFSSGYHEAGTAIHEHKFLGDYLKEYNPDDPILANKWVGLTASTLFDPVLYISFGATAPSKIIANRVLAESAKVAMTRSQKIIAEKGGWFFGTKYDDPVELMQAIRKADGMPMDLPGALDAYRATGMQYKSSMRQLKPFDYPDPVTGKINVVKPTPGRVIGSYLLPTAVRGGRGVRFAGMEVPFTGDLTDAMARRLRGSTANMVDDSKGPIARAIVHGFTTNPQLRMAGDDTIRALALTEMAAFKAELQDAKAFAKIEARTAAKGGTSKYVSPEARKGVHTIEPPIIKQPLLKASPMQELEHIASDVPQPKWVLKAPEEIQNLHKMVRTRVEEEIQAAKNVKFTESEARDAWTAISGSTSDPIEAIGKFVFQNQVKVRSRQFIQRLLDNPLFATKVGKDERVPIGYMPVTSPIDGQKYAVIADMHDALDELMNPQFLDKSTKSVLEALSMPQNYWKQFATSANPSFHVMNFLGAVWNNLYAGIYNPADYLKAITTLYKSRIEEAHISGRTRYMGRTTASTGKRKAGREEAQKLVQEARIRGATSDTSSIYAEIQQGLQHGRETFAPSAQTTLDQRMKQLVTRRPGESRKRYALRQSRRATAGGLLATGNPVGVALLAPEAARVGRVVGTTIEDVVRLAPFMKAAHDPVLLRYMDAFGPIRVPGMVHPGFTKAQQSAMYDIGANISKHFQFDYSDLTQFERKWAKLIFPFYTFYRKNFVLQMQLLAQAPRGVHTAQAVMNFLNENGDVSDPMQQLLPEYFDQISAFQVPVPTSIRTKLGLATDQPLYLNPKLPFVSLNLMPDLWDVFRDTGQPTSQKMLQAFAPMLGSIGPLAPLPLPGMKTMLEAAVGQQLGLNKTIDYQRSSSNDWRNSYVPAPAWVQYLPKPVRNFMGIFPYMKTVPSAKPGGGYLMTATGQYLIDQMATPFVTNLGQVIPAGGVDTGKTKADTVSWLTGIRLIPVDMLRMHRSWAYRLREILQSKQQDLKDQGKLLEPQDQVTLGMVKAQIQALEAAWDTRQLELYGAPKGG